MVCAAPSFPEALAGRGAPQQENRTKAIARFGVLRRAATGLGAGERLPPDVGDRQPCHLDRPPSSIHNPWCRRREAVLHQAAQGLDREAMRQHDRGTHPHRSSTRVRVTRTWNIPTSGPALLRLDVGRSNDLALSTFSLYRNCGRLPYELPREVPNFRNQGQGIAVGERKTAAEP